MNRVVVYGRDVESSSGHDHRAELTAHGGVPLRLQVRRDLGLRGAAESRIVAKRGPVAGSRGNVLHRCIIGDPVLKPVFVARPFSQLRDRRLGPQCAESGELGLHIAAATVRGRVDHPIAGHDAG